MVTELPVACSVLAAARVLPANSCQRRVCPAPAVSVCEESLAPWNTLSNTSSSPSSPVRATLAAVLLPLAPPAVPSGVVWSTPAKLMAPATMPLLTEPLKFTVTVPETPLGGLRSL